ncbi:transcriptional regulator [Cerasicoccus maritimus]|uniref:transcriptional regulator n=1 Tax=Cerasicoccus maritimus TaxID=490089 RepID=UPI0028527091|nr:transcriptional regulator [Cerasicoccus maritimus]
MSNKMDNPYDNLERIFHEPKRLAMIAAIAESEAGLSFSEIKETCDLTDGNLNRHLKLLEEEKIVIAKKSLAGNRARTIVRLSAAGRRKFVKYLESLEIALQQAAQSMGAKSKSKASVLKGVTA